jgi:hypothetical protein
MQFDTALSQHIYDHYLKYPPSLSDENRKCLAGAFRLLHEVSCALNRLDLRAELLPARDWESAVGLTHLAEGGYELRFELWLAIGPVGCAWPS